jgi:hypothetical protein
MASRPEDGVVDTDCRVFGIENLYVAGASVFPTGGHANPMMTIVALAIRLGEHLRQIGEAEKLGAQALEGKRMKVLVLGARGFIGGEIVNRLSADPMIEVIPAGRGRPGQAGGRGHAIAPLIWAIHRLGPPPWKGVTQLSIAPNSRRARRSTAP